MGNPYHDPKTGEFTTGGGGSQQYVFHGTPRKNFASIRRSGLRPNAYGNPLNFHHDQVSAQYYAGKTGVLLRVRQSDLPPTTKFDANTSRSWTSSSVPPEKIEFQMRSGVWKSDISKHAPKSVDPTRSK